MHPADPGGYIIADSVVFTVATLERQIGLRRVKVLLAPTSSPRVPASPRPVRRKGTDSRWQRRSDSDETGGRKQRCNLQVFKGAHTQTRTHTQ